MAVASSPILLEQGPAWEIARLFPDQGYLSESDYLLITDQTNRLAEFVAGKIEVLPMPTIEHQRIVLYLLTALRAFIIPRKLGEALMAPLRVKIADAHYREPDIVFLSQAKASRQGNRYWEGPDLVIEVVSEDQPKRDLVDKRRDYADAGISEYWIVDPRGKSVTVLRLEAGAYGIHSEATDTGRLSSALLDGFSVETRDIFAAARHP